MASFDKLVLFAFLQRVRSSSLGSKLRAFILRCLLLWPRILRNIRKVWSWYFQTSSRDEKKTKGDTGGLSSTERLRKREDCVVVCASRDWGGGDKSSRYSISGSNDADQSIPLEVVSSRTPSVHSLSPSYAPSQGSPMPSPRHLSAPGSPHGSTSSLRTGHPDGAMEFYTHRGGSNTSVNYSPSRATSRRFIGEPSRSHPRPSSPSSPSRLHFSKPSTPTRHDNEDIEKRQETQAPIQQPQVFHEGSTPELFIRPASPPPGDAENMYGFPRPQFPSVQDPTQSLPTHYQLPSSTGNSQDVVASQSIQAPRPWPSVPRISTQFSTTNALNAPPRPDTLLVRPMHSDLVSRYMKKGDVEREMTTFVLEPMTFLSPHSYNSSPAGGWIPITHPDGALYFYHDAKRTFTDVYMYDPRLRKEVEQSVEVLENKISELAYNGTHFLTNSYDLVLDLVETEDGLTNRQYYYVDHNNRTLFWLEPYEINPGVPGVKDRNHIKTFLESHYWTHWSLYPIGYRGRTLPDGASEELLGILLSNSIDALTSKASTAPYSVVDMQTMSDIINKTKDLGSLNPHNICSVARLLSFCVMWKFTHFHGQKTSRLDRYKSIYKDSDHKRTKPFQLLSVILFFTPDVHLRELKKVWADEVIIEEIWKNFMQNLISEWIEFVLYSTVMLAGNVGFLAIQGVIVIPQEGWIKASPAQIASSISLSFSLGSIITGLVLIRRNRTMAMQDPATACEYLYSMKSRFFYLEPLAIIFSLTYALLMWSVCAFFVALLLFSFQNEMTRIRIPVGVASGIVVVLIIWCIVNCWDSSLGDSEREELIVILPEGEKNVA